MSELQLGVEEMLPHLYEKLAAGKSLWIRPGGTSMLPMLQPGKDYVLLSPLPEKLKKYDLPLYRRDNGIYVLHRIIKTKEHYTCIGDNEFTKEPGIRRDQMIALVTGFIHKGREYSVQMPKYRAYCVFWHYSRFFRRGIRSLCYRLRRLFGCLKSRFWGGC